MFWALALAHHGHLRCCSVSMPRKGDWTPEEDTLLKLLHDEIEPQTHKEFDALCKRGLPNRTGRVAESGIAARTVLKRCRAAAGIAGVNPAIATV